MPDLTWVDACRNDIVVKLSIAAFYKVRIAGVLFRVAPDKMKNARPGFPGRA